MNAHILVVEDEQKLANNLALYFEAEGFRVTVLHEGNAVMETVSREQIDIVLLDWLLPGVDGLTLCRRLRESGDVPIIMMTARVEEADRIEGMETGADDYICKPFSLRETVARVRAVLRRRQHKSTTVTNGLCIDDAAHRITFNAKEIDLTLAEYHLLKTLYTTPGRAFTRDELLNNVYRDSRIVTDGTINVHIKNLRRKLKEYGLDGAITTIYGLGYRWK
jgi:two-component system response regulator BaeR